MPSPVQEYGVPWRPVQEALHLNQDGVDTLL